MELLKTFGQNLKIFTCFIAKTPFLGAKEEFRGEKSLRNSFSFVCSWYRTSTEISGMFWFHTVGTNESGNV